MGIEVEIIPAFEDNYFFLLFDKKQQVSAVVDPGSAKPVLEVLQKNGMPLNFILTTHHHKDHTGGHHELLRAYPNCTVVGSKKDKSRIPGISLEVSEGDRFFIGDTEVEVLETFGHTIGHVSYWLKALGIVFVGDTLFALGCGRIFEGSALQMWASLKKLSTLPEQTKIYCAHEYTLSNAHFAVSIDSENELLAERYRSICSMREKGLPTVPTTLKEELETNPFLRADTLSLQKKLGMEGADPAIVFAEIRKRKDSFRL